VRIDSEGSPKCIAQLPPRGGFDRVGFRDLVVVGRLSPLFFDGTAGNPKHLGYLLLLFLSVPPPARIEAGRCSTHCFYSIHDKKAKPYKQRDKSWHKQDASVQRALPHRRLRFGDFLRRAGLRSELLDGERRFRF
jgi:hypothetical protein